MQNHVLFFTSENPSECAEYLDDFRVMEQLRVTCSMLSTAIYLNRSAPGLPVLKPAIFTKLMLVMNANESCVVWVRLSRDNYRWTCNYLRQLIIQVKRRNLRISGTPRYMTDYMIYRGYTMYIPDGKLTEKPNTTIDLSRGINYTYIKNVYNANRLFLQELWKVEKFVPKFTNVPDPRRKN